MQVNPDEWGQLREDVGYIKSKIELVPEHEIRIRKVEQFVATTKAVLFTTGKFAILVGVLAGVVSAVHPFF